MLTSLLARASAVLLPASAGPLAGLLLPALACLILQQEVGRSDR